MIHNVTSIIDLDHTYLVLTHEGQQLLIRKEYVTTAINIADTDIVEFKWHWYEKNLGARLFYLGFGTVTDPATGSADALKDAIDRMLITQHHFPAVDITSSRALLITDAKRDLICNSVADLTLTIPLNSSVPFHIWEEIDIFPYNTGNVVVTPAVGVTLLSNDGSGAVVGAVTVTGPYNCAKIRQIKLDTWRLCGIVSEFIDPDVQDFLDATGIVDEVIVSALNNMVIDLKAVSLWDLFIAIYPFVGGTAATHKWNLVNPLDTDAAFRLTFFGTITHDANGADPNGSTGYAVTHIIANTDMTANNGAIGYFGGENIAGGGTERSMGCFVSGSNPCISIGINRDGSTIADFNNFSSNRITVAASATSVGLWVNSRTNSTTHKLYQAGTEVGTNSTANASGHPTTKALLFAVNTGGVGTVTASNHTSLRCKWAFFTNAGLSAAQVTSLTGIVNQFQTDLGR